MSTKSFKEVRKPGRRPTLEEIADFEESGRVKLAPEAAGSANTETQKAGKTEISVHANLTSRDHGNVLTQLPGLPDAQEAGKPVAPIALNADSLIPPDAETQKPDPIVRLTIDLPENIHTRFKAACALTRRKMVEEVRGFIERRTAELEADPGRQQ
jgi:hypothetical protein